MDQRYLAVLPAEVRALVEPIESLIGSEIVVRRQREGDPTLVPEGDLAVCDCFMNNGVTTVTITFPGEDISQHVLIHEIFHAHRKIVEKVHWLVAAVNEEIAVRFATRIDNDVEHLFIIPLEISYAPEALGFWESHYDRRLAEALESREHPLVLRDNLLRHWLVSSSVIPQWHGLGQLRSALAAKGWLGEGERLVEKIARVKSSKPQCVATLLRFLKLESRRYCLSQFFVSEKRCPSSMLPAH